MWSFGHTAHTVAVKVFRKGKYNLYKLVKRMYITIFVDINCHVFLDGKIQMNIWIRPFEKNTTKDCGCELPGKLNIRHKTQGKNAYQEGMHLPKASLSDYFLYLYHFVSFT